MNPPSHLHGGFPPTPTACPGHFPARSFDKAVVCYVPVLTSTSENSSLCQGPLGAEGPTEQYHSGLGRPPGLTSGRCPPGCVLRSVTVAETAPWPQCFILSCSRLPPCQSLGQAGPPASASPLRGPHQIGDSHLGCTSFPGAGGGGGGGGGSGQWGFPWKFPLRGPGGLKMLISTVPRGC